MALTLAAIDAQLAEGEAPFADYVIEAALAEGRAARVFRARHRALNRRVALKVLVPRAAGEDEDLVRFYGEAEAIAALRHPNIVTVHHVGLFDGLHYLVMDYVAGPTLAQLQGGRPLSTREALRTLIPVVRAVDAAHQHGIIHRDIKPHNILIDEGGYPLLTDFGLAKKVNADTTITQTGVALGTPPYMPPEQIRGESAALDARTDIYALGATLFELVTGRPPFTGASGMEIFVRVLDEPPPSPRKLNPDVSDALDRVVLKCLAKAPEDRYQSAPDLLADLVAILDDERFVQVRRRRSWHAAWRVLRRAYVPAVTLIALAGLLALALSGPEDGSRTAGPDANPLTPRPEALPEGPGVWRGSAQEVIEREADGSVRVEGAARGVISWAEPLPERYRFSLWGTLRIPDHCAEPRLRLHLGTATLELGASWDQVVVLRTARRPWNTESRPIVVPFSLRRTPQATSVALTVSLVVEPGRISAHWAADGRQDHLEIQDPMLPSALVNPTHLSLEADSELSLEITHAELVAAPPPFPKNRAALGWERFHTAIRHGPNLDLMRAAQRGFAQLLAPPSPIEAEPWRESRVEEYEARLGLASAQACLAFLHARDGERPPVAEESFDGARREYERLQELDESGVYAQRSRMALLDLTLARAAVETATDQDAARALLAGIVAALVTLCDQLNAQHPPLELRQRSLQGLLDGAEDLAGAPHPVVLPRPMVDLAGAAFCERLSRDLVDQVRQWTSGMPWTEARALSIMALLARHTGDLERRRQATRELCEGFRQFPGFFRDHLLEYLDQVAVDESPDDYERTLWRLMSWSPEQVPTLAAARTLAAREREPSPGELFALAQWRAGPAVELANALLGKLLTALCARSVAQGELAPQARSVLLLCLFQRHSRQAPTPPGAEFLILNELLGLYADGPLPLPFTLDDAEAAALERALTAMIAGAPTPAGDPLLSTQRDPALFAALEFLTEHDQALFAALEFLASRRRGLSPDPEPLRALRQRLSRADIQRLLDAVLSSAEPKRPPPLTPPAGDDR